MNTKNTDIQKRLFGMVSTRASLAYTAYAVKSFFATTSLRAEDEFILIDNDGSLDPAPYQGLKGLTLLGNSAPLSFSANGNQLLRQARDKGQDLYFLNNDLIFTPRWDTFLETGDQTTILSPLSNMQTRYKEGDWEIGQFIDLKDYLGNEQKLITLSERHASQHQGVFKVPFLYFFCVKIPYQVQMSVGFFDEGFFSGGEDIDYCLRAYLEGFGVHYALASYVLHFQGKSTWRGPESEQETQARTQKIYKLFVQKWGADLYNLVAFQKESVLDKYPASLKAEFASHHYKPVIEALRATK